MTWSGRGKIAFAGVGFSPIQRDGNTSLGEMARVAIANAIADAGLAPSDIDGLATYSSQPAPGAAPREGIEVVGPEYVLANCGVGPARWYAHLNGGMVTAAIVEAAMALLGGACSYALVWRAMHHPGTAAKRPANAQTVAGNREFSAPYGCATPVQWHALAYRRYVDRFGATRAQLATLALVSRRNANLNEHAFFRDKPLDFEGYMGARMISDPLCLLDCDIPVQACIATVMTTADRARDLRNKPAWLAGFAMNAAARAPIVEYTLVDYFDAGRATANQLWDCAGQGSADMDAAMLYDGFAPSTLYWLEAAGFCRRGEAAAFIQDGRIAIGGELPVNTFGGSLSQGRLHGMGHTVEAVLQASGRAGPRQLRDANAICVFAGSPMFRGSGLVITSQP